ncbi:unnamed protein product [Gadus morhua 'NCC']
MALLLMTELAGPAPLKQQCALQTDGHASWSGPEIRSLLDGHAASLETRRSHVLRHDRSVKEESLQQHTNAISATARCSSRDGFLLTRALARRFHCITPPADGRSTGANRTGHGYDGVEGNGKNRLKSRLTLRFLIWTSSTDPHDSQTAAQPVTPSSPADSIRSLDTAH